MFGCLAECWKILVKVRLNRYTCLVRSFISCNYCVNFIKGDDTFMACRASENCFLKLSSLEFIQY